MPRNFKPSLFVISFSLLISGCATPPNVTVFESLSQRMYMDPLTQHTMIEPSPTCMDEIGEPECGHGVAIVSGDEVYIGEKKDNWFKGKPWSQLKSESVFCPAEECYAPLGTYIINSCKQNHCSDDVTRFRIKLDSLNGIPGAIEN